MNLIQLLLINSLSSVSLNENKLITIDLEEVAYPSDKVEETTKKSGSFIEGVKMKFFTQKNSGELDFLGFKRYPKEPLTNSRNIQYVANIEIGTPPQEFKVALDTQSNPFWVTGMDCTDFSQCFLHPKFDPSKSKTYDKIAQDVYSRQNLYYAYVNLGQDKVKLGKLVFEDMVFGNAYYRFVTGQLPTHVDGILGLGIGDSEEDVNDRSSILGLLKDQGLNAVFSLYLNNKHGSKRGGALILGGYDSKHFKKPLRWYPLSSEKEWAVKVNAIKVKDDELELEDTEAIFDISLPWIEISPIVAELLNKKIGGQLKDPYGPYYLDCATQNQLPNISFKLGDDVYELKPEDYVFESYNQCISVIQPIRAQGSSKWVLGNRFLKKYYTVFDGEKFRIGLSKL